MPVAFRAAHFWRRADAADRQEWMIPMKTVLIVEDNIRSREMLVKILKNLRGDTIIKTASSLDEAGGLLMTTHFDLFMLDIILNSSNPNDVSGMKLAEYIRSFRKYKYTPIIFITALEDPALHAYSDLHCYHYVEKPYDAAKVSEVILDALNFPVAVEEERNVFFRKDGILYKKKVSDIIYIENTRAGQIVYCTNGNLKLPYRSSKAILQDLGCDKFAQSSRYHIVNKDFIESVDTTNRFIKLKDVTKQVELGNSYQKSFMKDVEDD